MACHEKSSSVARGWPGSSVASPQALGHKNQVHWGLAFGSTPATPFEGDVGSVLLVAPDCRFVRNANDRGEICADIPTLVVLVAVGSLAEHVEIKRFLGFDHKQAIGQGGFAARLMRSSISSRRSRKKA